jgi:hypothetical protein
MLNTTTKRSKPYRAAVLHYIRHGHVLSGSDSIPSPKDRGGKETNSSSSLRFDSNPALSLGEGNEFPPDLSLTSAQNDVSDECGTFRPLKASEILTYAKSTPMVWVWDRFIPQGSLVVLSSFMKVGKTELAYEFAMEVARGNPFLSYRTRKGRVLILAVEEHERDATHRLRGLGLKATDMMRLWPRPLDPPLDMLPKVQRYIVAHKVKLVILDTLSSFWQPDSENSNTDIHKWIAPLREMARETGAAVLLIHHDRKGGGQYGEQVRGGGDLLAQVDQALLLSRGQNLTKTQRLLTTLGRYRETPKALLLDWTGNPPRYVSLGAPTTTNVEQRMARVLSVLSEGAKAEDTLTEQTGLGPKPLKVVLRRLLAKKQVTVTGRGVKSDPRMWQRRNGAQS